MKNLKRILLLCVVVISSLQSHAQQGIGLQNFWGLKYSKQYSSQYVRAFDTLVNPLTGGGYFVWVKSSNNAAITDIPGLRIKPLGYTKGYWLRCDAGMGVQVAYFGSANTSNQKTWAEYGYSQARLDSLYSYFGASFVVTTDRPDGTAIRCAFKLMETIGYQCLTFEPKIYYIDRTCNLPRILSGTLSSDKYRYVIHGNGAQIVGVTGMVTTYFDRYPSSHVEAAGWIGAAFSIDNFFFKGVGTTGSGQCGIRLSATYMSILSGLTFKQIDIGMDLQWSMGAMVFNTEGNQCKTVDIYIRYGTYSGATNSGDQSNAVTVDTHRSFGGGGYAGIYIFGCSNVTVRNFIGEGGGAKYGIYFNTDGSTVVKEGVFSNIYGEGTYDSAAVYVRSGSGTYLVDRIYFRGTVTLVYLEAIGAYPQITVSNVTWWENTFRFCSRNVPGQTGCQWKFINVDAPNFGTVAEITTPGNNFWNLVSGAIPGTNRITSDPKIVH